MAGAPNPFDMSRMAIGGIGQMLDGVEFIKRAWSGLNIPSTMVPTVDIEELDKRIADLKAVEQWLNLNLSMLHGTIQGLEIQRGTLAAVKAFGATLGTLPSAAAEGVAARARLAPRSAPPPASAVAPDPAPPPAAPAPAPQPAAARKTDAKPTAKTGAKADAPADASTPSAAPAPAMLPRIDPTAWWNLLQQNFNQVAEAALSGVGLQNAAVGAMRAAGDAAGAIAKATTGARAREPVRDPAAGTGAKRPAAGRAPAKRRRAPAKPRAPKAPS
jgi:hypothetical protein